jgi:hypothetical protein
MLLSRLVEIRMESSLSHMALWVPMHLFVGHGVLSAHHIVVVVVLRMLPMHVVSSATHVHVVIPVVRRLVLLLIVWLMV